MGRRVHVFFADLHIGGAFDFRSFEKFRKICRRIVQGFHVSDVHVYCLGDIHDFQGLYRTQRTFFPGYWQSDAAVEVLYRFARSVGATAVHILPGNHDRRAELEIDLVYVLKEKLKKRFEDDRYRPVDVVVHEEGDVVDIGRKRVMLMHCLVPRSSGSYAAGITPRILAAGLEMILNRGGGVTTVIAGHHHVFAVTPYVILLPSFQYSKDPKYWHRGGVIFVDDDGEVMVIPIDFLQGMYREEEFWRDLMLYYTQCLARSWNMLSPKYQKLMEMIDELIAKYGEDILVKIEQKICELMS